MTKVATDRRGFLQLGGALAARLALGGTGLVAFGCDVSPYGPLQPPDENGIRLPEGFRSRVLARRDEVVPGTQHVWHKAPDGGAVFRAPGGWVYVSNAESRSEGGVGALRFDHRGEVVDAYSICTGTRRNCAGGATPWGTWLTCEEERDGLVYECDPLGRREAIVRPALGRFKHEAVAVDPAGRCLYLTEDEIFGRLYRFRPHVWPHLDEGVLEVARGVENGPLEWLEVPIPVPDFAAGDPPTRRQVTPTAIFAGGEGIVYDRDHIYFATKVDNTIWDLDLRTDVIRRLYRASDDPARQLTGVDNVAATRAGDLVVAEDGGNMELVILSRSGVAQPLLRVEGQDDSELTGPAFDPWGHHLYFSSQRGTDRQGITYVVSGPFGLG